MKCYEYDSRGHIHNTTFSSKLMNAPYKLVFLSLESLSSPLQCNTWTWEGALATIAILKILLILVITRCHPKNESRMCVCVCV
jgi:hypothetical protein